MRELVSSLIRLQELEIVLEESRIVHQNNQPDQLEEVEKKVAELRQSIPDQYLRRYDGLRRTGPGAVREVGGLCRGCHLMVPLGDLNRMQRGEMEWLCPNCGRFLLLEQGESEN